MNDHSNAHMQRHTPEGITMRTNRRFMALGLGGLVLAGFVAAGCSQAPTGAAAAEPAVHVEKNEATGLSTLTLSARAAERLGIATGAVSASGPGLAIPYTALVYDKTGKTWVYTNPQGRDFVRHEIEVERIEGDSAFLSSGPPVGTAVVTVGTAELWGVDTGVGGGH
jgi:hypothetical protein